MCYFNLKSIFKEKIKEETGQRVRQFNLKQRRFFMLLDCILVFLLAYVL